jgi:hypothetical protein
MAETIRRFFADAGTNSVIAFYNDDSGLGGYIFYVMNAKDFLRVKRIRAASTNSSRDATWSLHEDQ